MKAMILAAGLGTRLRPLTDSRPKALVEIKGRTLLEITIARLCEFGVQEIIVNVHHFADQVAEFLHSRKNFGIRIELSREDDCLLDTGGGLKKAAWFFLEDREHEPFIVHNVDVLSDIDLGRMLRFHKQQNSLASLAVQHRESSRQLLFDSDLQLCGRVPGENLAPVMVRTCEEAQQLAFCGIHVVSQRMLKRITEDGVFSIIDTYLRLSDEGEKIIAFCADEYHWRDLGKVEEIRKAEKEIQSASIRSR